MAKGSPRSARRPKGTGSISELKDGSGRVDAEVKTHEWDGTTTRHRKRPPSRHEGERWIRRILYEHERDMLPSAESEHLALSEYLASWLESIEGTVSRHTYRDYSDKVRLHIIPALGKVRLRDLTQGHLQKLYKRKLSEGLSPRSVRYIHVTLSKALHDAEGADLVRKNGVVMRWLGHSDVATTMKIYQQAPDELQERAADLMGELLFGGKTPSENEG